MGAILGNSLDIGTVNTLALFISDPAFRSTMAEVTVSVDGHTFVGSGVTKRMTGDPNTAEYGRLVALYRALESLTETVKAEVQNRA